MSHCNPARSADFSAGDRVRCDSTALGLARVSGHTGTIVQSFGNGIARVEWDGLTRRGDREAGENPRRSYPYVSDIGTIALTRL